MPLLPPSIPAPTGLFAQTLLGTALADTLTGGTGADLIYGGDGPDFITGGAGGDYLDGGAGNDLIAGSNGNDTMLGGDGRDSLYGGDGRDLMFGGAGDDLLQSGTGETTLVGGAGNDILAARQNVGGLKWLFGGEGADTFQIQFASAASYSETVLADFQLGVDTFTVDGASAASVVNAGSYITINGTQLFFSLITGDGLILDGPDSEALFQFFGLTGNDTIIGDGARNRIFGGLGSDVLDGADGNDLVVGGLGHDTLLGGRGHDSLGGNDGNDLLIGDEGNDSLYGHGGQDTLFGNDGTDMLYSGDRASALFGGSGADFLQARLGSGGDTTLSGGIGADSFEFFGLKAGRGADCVITDYEAGEAVAVGLLGLSDYIAAHGLSFSDTAGGARLDFVAGAGSITFTGWSAADLGDLFGWSPVAG